MQTAWKFGLIALVALVLEVLPGGGNLLDVVLTALTIAFFAAIAILVARMYRQYRLDIETLDSTHPARPLRLAGDRGPDLHRHRPPVQLRRRRRAGLVRAAGAGVLRPLLGLDALPPVRVASLSPAHPGPLSPSSARVPRRPVPPFRNPRALSRLPPGGTVDACSRARAESGQASVETVAIVPLVLLAAAVAWQLVLTGHTLWLCANAARAAARADLVGASPARAARSALPRSLERDLSVTRVAGDRIRVRLRAAHPAARLARSRNHRCNGVARRWRMTMQRRRARSGGRGAPRHRARCFSSSRSPSRRCWRSATRACSPVTRPRQARWRWPGEGTRARPRARPCPGGRARAARSR